VTEKRTQPLTGLAARFFRDVLAQARAGTNPNPPRRTSSGNYPFLSGTGKNTGGTAAATDSKGHVGSNLQKSSFAQRTKAHKDAQSGAI
jgi:hypothetical protein